MNYETEYEFDSGLAVVIDYEAVWDIDREDRDYYFIEFDAVWATLPGRGRNAEGRIKHEVDVYPALGCLELEAIEKHCYAHAERMMQEDP